MASKWGDIVHNFSSLLSDDDPWQAEIDNTAVCTQKRNRGSLHGFLPGTSKQASLEFVLDILSSWQYEWPASARLTKSNLLIMAHEGCLHVRQHSAALQLDVSQGIYSV